MHHLIFIFILFVKTHYSLSVTQSSYRFTTEHQWFEMPDGVRLSVTLTIPVAQFDDEQFPVLLEYKPYRKDDGFFNSDQATIIYLARRGFIVR